VTTSEPDSGTPDGTAVARAAALAALGRGPALDAATSDDLRSAATTDPDPRVRAAAVAAITRVGVAASALTAWTASVADRAAAVRRRAAEMGPALAGRANGGSGPMAPQVAQRLVAALGDEDVTVVEAAAWALGELSAHAVDQGAVPRLAEVTTSHPDPIAREAAVAALGGLGDPDGLPAILLATRDKPTVRRRAVLALAPFDGDEVDAALQRALDDRDWQVRQAAEDLVAEDPVPEGSAPEGSAPAD